MISIKNKLEELNITFSEKFTKGASYLLADGSYCNLSDQKLKPVHNSLDAFILKNKLVSNKDLKEIEMHKQKILRPYFIDEYQYKFLWFTDNACILNDGNSYGWESCYIDLPPLMPKDKQLEQLILWIDNQHYNNLKISTLDVSLFETVKIFKLASDTTDYIINEIKKLYKSLKEPE